MPNHANPISDYAALLELRDNLPNDGCSVARASHKLELPGQARLAELFAASADPGAIGFVLAQIPRGARLLWVQDRVAQMETGRPCGAGIEQFGVDTNKMLLACAKNAADTLGALEEGLKCPALTAIIGEVWGNPKALSFAATKRLAFRAKKQGIHLYLLRFGGQPDLSAARERWRIVSKPSAQLPDDFRAPGAPRWHVELFRAHHRTPGSWEASYDRAAHRLNLVPALCHSTLEEQEADAGSARILPLTGHRKRA